MGGLTEMKRLAIIITLSLVAAVFLCWSAMHLAQAIAQAETTKTETIQKEIDQ
jgi:hypothetical protein